MGSLSLLLREPVVVEDAPSLRLPERRALLSFFPLSWLVLVCMGEKMLVVITFAGW